MGERAQKAYEDDQRRAFRQLPLRYRAAANLKAMAFTGAVAFLLLLIFIYPLFANSAAILRPAAEQQSLRVVQSWSCSPRKTCKAISSCDEAMWYLMNCPWRGRLDGDSDGAPCEQLCGSNN